MTGVKRGSGLELDLPVLAGRLRRTALVLGVLSLIAVVVDGLLNGLSFAVMARWLGLFLLLLTLSAAVLVALSAVRGAGTAQQRGERLSSGDVGWTPPRRNGDVP